MHRLVGIDFNKYKTSLQPLFQNEPMLSEIHFHDKAHIDEKLLDELISTFYYVDYVTLLPKFKSAVVNSNLNNIKDVPSMNEDSICQALDIDYSLRFFKFFNIFQALQSTTKASRIDSDNEKMKIIDVGNGRAAKKMVQEYIRKKYENQYASDLAVKRKLERTESVSLLVTSILQATSHDDIVNLMRNGVNHGNLNMTIENSSSLGFIELKQKLLDLKESVPNRLNILKVFLLGRDDEHNDEPVWNNGNVLFTTNLSDYEDIFTKLGHTDEWLKLKAQYIKRRLYIYRDELLNRYGHGNVKPSYWAYGYATLQRYKDNVSPEEFNNYCQIHSDCCGVSEILGLIK